MLLISVAHFGSEIVYASAAGFLASFAAHLWAMGRKFSNVFNLGTAIAAAAATALIQHFHSSLDVQNLIVLLGLFLITMVAAYLRPNVIMEAFWRFNLQLAIAMAMALSHC